MTPRITWGKWPVIALLVLVLWGCGGEGSGASSHSTLLDNPTHSTLPADNPPPSIPYLAVSPAALNNVILSDTSGVQQTNRVVSIPRPFVQGQIANFAQASINGIALFTQCDVKNRWPDGSVKFAIVSFIVPAIPVGGSVVVSFSDQSSGNNTTPLTKSDMLTAAYNFDGQIQLTGTVSNNISARAMLNAAPSCNDPGADPDGGKFLCTYWMKGPIVTAVILEDRTPARSFDVNTDGNTGKPLHPIFEAWFYPQGHYVQLGYTLENAWASTAAVNSMRDQNYSLRLTGGNSNPVSQYANATFKHITRTRWHKTFQVNGTPPSLHIDNNWPYWAQTKFLPHWDTDLKIASSLIATKVNAFNSSVKTLEGNANGIGNFEKGLNAGGASDWHGPLTTWDIIYLISQDDGMKSVMLGNADLGGRIPYFYREADTNAGQGKFFDNAGTVQTFGRVVSINARTQVELDDVQTQNMCPTNYPSDWINIGGSGQNTDGWDLDASHWPNLAYAAYLNTGQHAYYEEQLMQSAYAIGYRISCVTGNNPDYSYNRQGSAGYWPVSQERETVWVARENAIGAFIAVDGSPEKAYFEDKLYNNIAVWEGEHNIPNNTPGDRSAAWTFGNSVRTGLQSTSPLGIWAYGVSDYVANAPLNQSGANSPASADANFMAAYSAFVIGFINDLGYDTSSLLRFVAKRYINIALNPSANVYSLADYVFPTKDNAGNPITSWSQAQTFYASQRASWLPCNAINMDESYGHEGLAVLSYMYGLVDGTFKGSDAYNLVRSTIGCITGESNSFQASSPKWDITPRPQSAFSGSTGWQQLMGTALKGPGNPSPCPPNGFNGYNPIPEGYLANCGTVITAWNSAIADPSRNRLIIWGGGHNDYGGNEVYSLELSQNPPALIRLNPPSSPNLQAGINVETLSDGRPNSRHTYDSLVYLPTLDKMLAFGGSLNNLGNPGNATWELSLSSVLASCAPNCAANWTNMNPATIPSATVGVTSDYDWNTGLVWMTDQSGLWSWNTATNNNWVKRADASLGYQKTSAIDPLHQYYVSAGAAGNNGNGIVYWSIAPGSTFTKNVPVLTNCGSALNGAYPGFQWDPVDKVFVIYPNGGNVIYLLNPVNWTCTSEAYGLTQGIDYPQSTANTANGSGTFKHFAYFANQDMYVLCNDAAYNCWTLHRKH